MADAATWLAVEIGDAYLLGRSLRTTANVLHVQGDYPRAVDRYGEALEQFETAGDDLEAAITRSSALQSLAYLGRSDEAENWAEAAEQVFMRKKDRLRLARLQVNLATIVFRQERFKEALKLFETAYPELLEIGTPQDVAHCLGDLATLLVSLRDLSRAEEAYRQARDYCQQEQLPLLEAEVDYNIAYLHYLRGQYTRAIELYRKTRRKCDETGEVYRRALCDLDESEIYLELNLVEEAVEAAERAHLSFGQLGMAFEKAKALTFLAIGRIRQGQLFLGLELLDQAREIFDGESNRVWVGLVLLHKALALARENRRFEASQLARDAFRIFEAEDLPSKMTVCQMLEARLKLLAGDPEGARHACHAALQRLKTLDLPSLEYQAHFVLGQIEEASGRDPQALEAYTCAHASLERLRSKVQTEELKIRLVEDKLEVYESLVTLLAQQRIPGPDPRVAFEHIEKSKARSLSDLMAFRGRALPSRAAGHSAQAERVYRLREELNWYNRCIELQESQKELPTPHDLPELRNFSRLTEEELEASLRDLAKTDHEFTSLQNAATGSLEKLRSAIPEDAVLLEYYFARDTVFACVVDRQRLDLVPVSEVSRVRELAEELFSQFARLQSSSLRQDSRLVHTLGPERPILRELWNSLLGPLSRHLDAKLLIVVPHHFLHHLPFQALFDGEQHLVDRHPVCYAPSAHVFSMCRTQPPSAASGHLLFSAAAESDEELDREARSAAQALPGADSVLASEATLGTLRRLSPGRRYLHLFARGSYRRDNPMFSSLQLADGHLNIFDLYGLELSAEVVTVSGAGRRLRELTNGDAWVGLGRGLLYAGAQCALLPMWNTTADAASSHLASLIRHLGGGQAPVEAAREAMLETRDVHPHPFYWASYALVGAPGLAS